MLNAVFTRLQTGKVCGGLNGILQPANLINQANLQRIRSDPDATLSDFVYSRRIYIPISSNLIDAHPVRVLGTEFDQLTYIHAQFSQRTELAGQTGRANAVHVHAQKAECALKRRKQCAYANRSRKRCRTGPYLVGQHGNVVPARRRHATHGYDEWFASSLQNFELIVDNFRGKHATARTVDAEHYCFNRIVFGHAHHEAG